MRASWMIKAAWMCVTTLAWVCAATHAAEEGSDWYPFTPKEDVGPSVIGMQDWLDRRRASTAACAWWVTGSSSQTGHR